MTKIDAKKYAIITGASSGIGYSVAKALSDEEELMVVAVGRNQDALHRLKEENPSKIILIVADISTEEGRHQIKDMVGDDPVQYLVHCAAVLEPIGPVQDIDLTSWRQSLFTNLEAPIFITKILSPNLHGGRVLHLSSKLAHQPLVGLAVNCITKAALYMAFQCLREELRSAKIDVGSVRPGAVHTPMQAKVREATEEKIPAQPQFQALYDSGKLIRPEKAAKFIKWILTETSNEAFCEKEWNIYDEEHHTHWLTDKEELEDRIQLKS